MDYSGTERQTAVLIASVHTAIKGGIILYRRNVHAAFVLCAITLSTISSLRPVLYISKSAVTLRDSHAYRNVVNTRKYISSNF